MSRSNTTALGARLLALLALSLLCIIPGTGAAAIERRTTPRNTPASNAPRPPDPDPPMVVDRGEPHPALRDHGFPVQNRPYSQAEIDQVLQDQKDDMERWRAATDPKMFSQSVFQLAGPVQGPRGGVRAAPPPNYVVVEHDKPRKEEKTPFMEDQRRRYLGFRKVMLFREQLVHKLEPLVATYQPPFHCQFNRVLLNLSVSAVGTRPDRIATLSLGDVEIWRMTTAQPRPDKGGVVWSFSKDVTPYLALWRKSWPLTFRVHDEPGAELGDDAAPLEITLEAYFWITPEHGSYGEPAHAVVALGEWTYPRGEASTKVLFPPNTRRAMVSVAATARGAEEYWWSNPPDSQRPTLKRPASDTAATPLGYGSALRELRLSIDGHPAGVAWPVPLVAPGGLGIPMHRPAVPPQAFDLRELEIDVSPWLPYLRDGNPHVFGLDVYQFHDADLGPDGNNLTSTKVSAGHWHLGMKIFEWFDASSLNDINHAMPTITNNSLEWYTEPERPPRRPVNSTDRHDRYGFYLRRLFRLETKILRPGKDLSVESWNQDLEARVAGSLDLHQTRRTVRATYKGQSHNHIGRTPHYHEAFENTISAYFQLRAADELDGDLYEGPDANTTTVVHAGLSQDLMHTVFGGTAFATGVEPWVNPFSKGKPFWDLPPAVSVWAQSRGAAVYRPSADRSLIEGISSSQQSIRVGMTPYAITNLPLGFCAEPLLYRRDVIFNGKEVSQDSEWTYDMMHMPYDHGPSSDILKPYDHRPSTLVFDSADPTRDGLAAQQLETFAPIGPGETSRWFMDNHFE